MQICLPGRACTYVHVAGLTFQSLRPAGQTAAGSGSGKAKGNHTDGSTGPHDGRWQPVRQSAGEREPLILCDSLVYKALWDHFFAMHLSCRLISPIAALVSPRGATSSAIPQPLTTGVPGAPLRIPIPVRQHPVFLGVSVSL
jgi:hypothetical protein